ncbi:hypothetical protein ACIBO1_02495 [Micromonospora sp. NPDC049903]|uniref:hypothetical protein n=1 Tax=Micromonospora sp. NPDC049903 TaxID=3364276 RepID=UPI00379C8D46
MTTPHPGPASDDPWRRPDTGDGPTPGTGAESTAAARPEFTPGPAPRRPASDDPWRPPTAPAPGPTTGPGGVAPGGHGPAGYGGPPPTTAPPPGWRPPVHLQAAPPRRLPAQDMAALDAQEQRAQRLTWVIGGVAGAVLVVVVCLLCSRAFL